MTAPKAHAAPPDVHAADFIAESRTVDALPPIGPPEIAISGRSNVGKSTLLNRLAGRKGLARTSKTPGRTRGIVFFDLVVAPGRGGGALPRPLRLADMPGYGYAQVARTERSSWRPLIEGYTKRRPTLALFVVLVDARRGVEEEERQLLEWLASLAVPTQVVVTKVDKLSASERGLMKDRLRAAVAAAAPGAPRPLLVSGQTGEGVDALWSTILVCSEQPPRVT